MKDYAIRRRISIVDDYCEDISDNPCYYFCQVYKDVDQTIELDDFCIRKNDVVDINNYDEVEAYAINTARDYFD